MALTQDGVVVAILNDRQVLVKFSAPDQFAVGMIFSVYGVQKLPADIAKRAGVEAVELPKGKLKCEALQSNSDTALLSVWSEVRTRTRKKLDALGLGNPFDEEVIVAERIGESAKLAEEQSLKLSIGPVSVGDFVSAD